MRFLALVLSSLLAPNFATAQAVVVKGRVLLDNGNGKIDAADKGLADVLVTDGVQFVRTAADGSFAITVADDPVIPYRPAQVISVSWPTGTWPVKQNWYARLGEVKPGASVEFLLRDDKQKLPFTVMQGTDPHNDLTGLDAFRDDIDRMDRQVNFGIMTGDLGYMSRDNADKSFTSIAKFTHEFPTPLLHTCGNHDICDIHTLKWSEPHSLAGYGAYTKYLGPVRYSFNYAGTHFVGLDFARVMPDGKLQTGVPDIAIDWLAKDLAELPARTRIFVYMHHYHRHGDDKLWDLFVKHNVELVLAGHSHRNLDQSRRGVKALTTQNLCGPYRLLTVKESGHHIVDRCYASNGETHAHSYAGECKVIGYRTLKVTRGKDKELPEHKVKSEAVKLIELPQTGVEFAAEIDPGTAKKYGLRFGASDMKGKPLEVMFSGEDVTSGDVHTAAVRARGQKTAYVHVVLADGRARVYVNSRASFERPFEWPQAGPVTLFAEEGEARFTKMTLTELTNIVDTKK